MIGDAGEQSRGYLGVFASFAIVAIDPASGRSIDETIVAEGVARSIARATDGNPLSALTPREILAEFEALVESGLERELAALLKRAGR